VKEGLQVFAVYGFVPVERLTRAERRGLYGAPRGAWIRLARISARTGRQAVEKAKRQAWCRDERVSEYRAECLDGPQRALFVE
jgi:hypothetical protein